MLRRHVLSWAPLGASIPLMACADPVAADVASGSYDPGRVGVLASYDLYTDPNSNYADQAAAWRASRPDDAARMDYMADQPVGTWIGDWTSDPAGTVDAAISAAAPEIRTFVVYNIPHRDCGAWSAGGVSDAAAYASFIQEVADGINGRLALVVLEPDALPLVTCLTSAQVAEREQMLSDAVDTLTAAGARVYLDAGDSNWISAADMASRLANAGVARAAGFSLNVSHTEYTLDELAYAKELRLLLGRRTHFVIDTGRNGLGPAPDNEWCNPAGRALGAAPTTATRVLGFDAKIWIKPPGESDGSCNGGPSAGTWWPEYANDLAINAGL